MSTDFGRTYLLRCIIGILQCNILAQKIVVDGRYRKELLWRRQSGIVLFTVYKTLIRLVLIDGDKIQFASGAIAVQDYSAEAEKLGVRSLFYQPLREDMA